MPVASGQQAEAVFIINTLAPIIVVTALGAVLRRTGFISAELTAGLNKVTFFVGMPCLLFVKIATASFEAGPSVRIALTTVGVMAGVLIVTDLVQRMLSVAGPVRGAVSQASFRSNCVYIGLVVLLYALEGRGDVGVSGSKVERSATLALGVIIPFLSIGSVLVLVQTEGASRIETLRSSLRSVVTNPFVLACVAATPFSLFDWTLPAFLTRSCEALGRMALPAALLGIGASLRWEPVRRHLGRSLMVTAIKLAIMPLLGWAVIHLADIPDDEAFAIMIFLTCPTAVSAYVMADQMRADAELTAAIIVTTTVLAVIPLTAVLALYSGV